MGGRKKLTVDCLIHIYIIHDDSRKHEFGIRTQCAADPRRNVGHGPVAVTGSDSMAANGQPNALRVASVATCTVFIKPSLGRPCIIIELGLERLHLPQGTVTTRRTPTTTPSREQSTRRGTTAADCAARWRPPCKLAAVGLPRQRAGAHPWCAP